MSIHPLAGRPAPTDSLIDVDALCAEYYDTVPDAADPNQQVSFGTSGHRGTAGAGSFNEAHIHAITQAICEYRKSQGIDGPIFVGKDTHALSIPAEKSAIEVLAANGVTTVVQEDNGFTPTPVISHAILNYNKKRSRGLGDGIVITPSHNPPQDGGFKYNTPNGGPADVAVTSWIQKRANELLTAAGKAGVQKIPFSTAQNADCVSQQDFAEMYIRELSEVVDMEHIRESGIRLGVDPLGGASVEYWQIIAKRYGIDLAVVNTHVDPRFSFMTLDHDGKIRMDCSSPSAMAGLVAMKEKYDVAFGNDPDADRHGIVVPGTGLMNPNHYLAVAIAYLFSNRPQWPSSAGVGKTLVSSSLIDRVAKALGKTLVEVPVGFKWFVDGLYNGTLGFGGEESAGASFLRKDGSVWSTDKDGIILNLLAAEITAVTGRNPGEHFAAIANEFGTPHYTRIDQPASAQEKALLKKLSAQAVKAKELGGEPIRGLLTRAPGNDAEIGGLKVTADNGWFAARPSGTEDVYKIYAESFKDKAHLERIVNEAKDIVKDALSG